MKSKNYYRSKVTKFITNLIFIDIDNILDVNAEKMFIQNVSNNCSSKSSQSKKSKKKKKTLSDFLKNGSLNYSLDSYSNMSNDEKSDKKDDKNKKPKMHKNFVLKSELFSSFEDERKMKSEKASPKPSLL